MNCVYSISSAVQWVNNCDDCDLVNILVKGDNVNDCSKARKTNFVSETTLDIRNPGGKI